MFLTSHAMAEPVWPPAVRRVPEMRRAAPVGTLIMSPCYRLVTGALCGADVALAGAAPAAADATSNAWLLRAACVEGLGWAGLGVTVALPPGSVKAGTLLAQADAALRGSGLLGGGLTLALAEADLADSRPELLLIVSALRDLGVGVAITLRSRVEEGLRILRRLPLTAVRLPTGLTGEVVCDRNALAAVARVVRQARAVDATVVALGVESASQRDILTDLGCDTALGGLFGHDLPACAFRSALAAQVYRG